MNSTKISLAIDKLKKKTEIKLSLEDMNYLGRFIANMIRKRTRLGYGVKDNGEARYKLDSLEDSTIDTRNRLKKRGELSPLTSKGKSNLTMTGQMLDAIKWVASKMSIRVFIDDSRRNDSEETNKKIAEYVSEKRPFFKVSDSEIRQIKREAVKLIKESLKN